MFLDEPRRHKIQQELQKMRVSLSNLEKDTSEEAQRRAKVLRDEILFLEETKNRVVDVDVLSQNNDRELQAAEVELKRVQDKRDLYLRRQSHFKRLQRIITSD